MHNIREYLLAPISAAVLMSMLTTVRIGRVAAQACVPAPPGMTSWWPGDGNANDIQGGNNGTLQNGATFAPGVVGPAFSFDGVDDYVDVGDVDLPSTFTIDAWIHPNSGSTNQMIVSKDDGVGPARSYYFDVEPGETLVGSVRNAGGGFTQYRTAIPVVTVGSWQHVAMTYDGAAPPAGKMAFYVNGVSYPTSIVGPYDSGGAPENDALSMKVGIMGDALTDPFDGLIDELEFFNRTLTAAEIQGIYNAGSVGKCRDADGDGVPDSVDQCPNSNMSPKVVIGGCDSGVPNMVFPNGCTLLDKIQQCAAGAENHGEFISCIARLTDELKRSGVITGQQKGAIQSCAAQSSIP